MHITPVFFLWAGLVFGVIGLIAPPVFPRLNWVAGCVVCGFAYLLALHG